MFTQPIKTHAVCLTHVHSHCLKRYLSSHRRELTHRLVAALHQADQGGRLTVLQGHSITALEQQTGQLVGAVAVDEACGAERRQRAPVVVLAIASLYCVGEAGGGANGKRSLEGPFLPGCILTTLVAVRSIAAGRAVG